MLGSGKSPSAVQLTTTMSSPTFSYFITNDFSGTEINSLLTNTACTLETKMLCMISLNDRFNNEKLMYYYESLLGDHGQLSGSFVFKFWLLLVHQAKYSP